MSDVVLMTEVLMHKVAQFQQAQQIAVKQALNAEKSVVNLIEAATQDVVSAPTASRGNNVNIIA